MRTLFRTFLASVLAALLAWLASAVPVAADIYDENADDAPPGSAVPLTCGPHPSAPAGSRLCRGFVLSRVSGNPARPPTDAFHVALDVDLAVPPGSGPHPLLVQVHGYGGDKDTPENDARILAEGIAFVRYTTRGLGESYGDTQLADEDFEVRDLQNIVRQLVEGTAFASPPPFTLNRKRIAVTGVSYGGGHTLLAAQTARRTWPCGPDECRLVTAVATAPWSDLIYALVPNGRPFARADKPGYVIGVSKLSYTLALFLGGLRIGPRYGGTSYPPFLFSYQLAVLGGEPYQDPTTKALAPLRAPVMAELLKTFSADRSPAYQDYCSKGPLPLFVIQGWTDDLFTAHEALRLRNVLDAQCSKDNGNGNEYPLKLYLGNSGHPRATTDDAAEQEYIFGLARQWLRHYLLGKGPRPAFDVTSGVTHPPGQPFDPSAVFTVDELEDMRRGELRGELGGTVRITNPGLQSTLSGPGADPLAEMFTGSLGGLLDGGALPVSGLVGRLTQAPVVGPLLGDAAVYRLPLSELVSSSASSRTLCGMGTLSLTGRVTGTDVTYAVRVWDEGPGGAGRTLVDRGVYRWLGRSGGLKVNVPLHGNAWRLARDHTLEVEITNIDAPYLRPNNLPSTTTITSATLHLPTCEPGTQTAKTTGTRAT